MKRLCHIKECLMGQVSSQMGHLETVNAKELGEVIDMIKDLEEAIYYSTITEAMHEKDPYYSELPSDDNNYPENKVKEGKSPKTRRMYMESKETHNDKTVQIQNLEQYMKELSSDIVEMIQGASPEEKQLLKSKLTTLISKIDHA